MLDVFLTLLSIWIFLLITSFIWAGYKFIRFIKSDIPVKVSSDQFNSNSYKNYS